MKIKKNFLANLKAMLINLENVRTTDGKDLMVDGDVEVGKDIMIADDNGEYEPAPSGEYDLGDTTLVVEAGRITEIRENKSEGEGSGEGEGEGEGENANAEDMKKQKFAAMKQAFEQTYEERYRKITAAIMALGYSEYGYIVEASDESAVWCYWDEVANEEHFVRFTLTWTGEDVLAADPVEVVPSFKPKDGEDEGAAATAENEALKAENEALKAENTALKEKQALAAVPPVGEGEGKAEQPLMGRLIDASRRRQ